MVEVDGTFFQDHFLMVNAANGSRFGGGFTIAPFAEIKDGLLEIVMVSKVPVLKRFYFLPKIQKGAHLTLPFVKYMKARSISIQSHTPLYGQLDGEVLAASLFEIEILPDQFQFRVLK